MLSSFIRTVLLYGFLIAAMRLLGKRQIGELEPSELAITILLSELAAIPVQDPSQPLATGLVPMLVLLALGILTSVITVASPTARRIIFGKPSIIIENGKLNQKEIRKLRISTDELAEELRLHAVSGLQAVKYGIVETNGQLSIILNDGDTPVTRRDLHIHTATPPPLPYTLIANGHLIRANLKKAGLTMEDVHRTLAKHNLTRISEAFYMSYDKHNGFHVIRTE